ncbi:MAG: hypothetical protein NVS2B4_05230 [Ramlibacter sp.]
MGGQTRWAGISGVSTERDFVEAPSQMLEEWVRDPMTLQGFTRRYQTGQPIPLELADKLREAEELGKGLDVRSQMSLAAISLGLHNRDPRGLGTTQFTAQVQEMYTPFKRVSGTYFHEAFGHLDGYSAVYCPYMWSLVIAKDMFSEFGHRATSWIRPLPGATGATCWSPGAPSRQPAWRRIFLAGRMASRPTRLG